jgi:surface protein
MSWMFKRATTFNQDIGDWDVGKVTDMSGMFIGADAFNQDIGRWNVGNLKYSNYQYLG